MEFPAPKPKSRNGPPAVSRLPRQECWFLRRRRLCLVRLKKCHNLVPFHGYIAKSKGKGPPDCSIIASAQVSFHRRYPGTYWKLLVSYYLGGKRLSRPMNPRVI